MRVCVSDTHTRSVMPPCQGDCPPGCAASGARGREAGAMPPTLPDVDAALLRAGRYRPIAERALADRMLDRDAALAVIESPDGELPQVLWAAFAARRRHFGRSVKLCVLQNARSGLCPEDCGYCSQSAVST